MCRRTALVNSSMCAGAAINMGFALCAQENSLLSRWGNPHVLTGALVEFSSFSDVLDDSRTSNDTRVTIDNNAGAVSALAGLNEATGSWDQCLQVRYISFTFRI